MGRYGGGFMRIDNSKPVSRGRPVAKAKAKGVADGAPAAAVEPVQDSASIMGIPEAELTPKVHAAIMALLEEVASLRKELEESKTRIGYLEQLADQDALVPVANRRAFVRELSRMASFAERYTTPSAVLYFDVNGMKKINDTMAHAAGDAAIKHVAKMLSDNVRESDIVGRLGGDEFGVILANADQAAAQEKAAFLASKIESQPFEWEGKKITLRVAYGAYAFKGGDDAHKALDAADRDMYGRKRNSSSSAPPSTAS